MSVTHKVRSLSARAAWNFCDPRRDSWYGNATTVWRNVTCKRCLKKRRKP